MSFVKMSLLMLMSAALLVGCHSKNPKTVKISVHLDKVKNARLDITTNNLLNLDTALLVTSKLDSTGSATFEIPLDRPIFATIGVAERFIPLLLSPGDELKVEYDTSKSISEVTFSGDGAIVQEHLRKAIDIKSKYEVVDGKHAIQAAEKDFISRLKGLKNDLKTLQQGLAKDKSVTSEQVAIINSMNNATIYFFQQNYVTGRYDEDIPEPMKSALKNFPQDTLALCANAYDYGLVLMSYLQRNIISTAGDKITDWTNVDIATETEKEIENLPFPKPLKEYFRAANIGFWVRMEGLSPELEVLRKNFVKDVKNPRYVSTINKSFDLWAPLAAGKPAPDFAGYTPNGERLSLSMLKGKVVYVDVWATWCGPCKEEFPDSKKLIKEFEGNDKVVFLFLSTDSNHDAWAKMLGDKSIPRGLHIHQKQENQPDAIWEKYLLWGIPRYILIDAEGKMVQAHAPRPSSGKVGDLLRKTIRI